MMHLKQASVTYVITASTQELMRYSHRERLRMAMIAKDMSSNDWVDHIIATTYEFEGLILTPERTIMPIPELNSVLNRRTISNFLRRTDEGSPKYDPPRNLEAVKFYDLSFRINSPDLARKIAR